MKRNDYKCGQCGEVTEFVLDSFTTDLECPHCHNHNMQLVFAKAPQMIVERASTVQKVMEVNRKRMEEIYEEDDAENSEYSKDVAAISHRAIVDG